MTFPICHYINSHFTFPELNGSAFVKHYNTSNGIWMTLIVILTACLLWQGSILMVIRQRLKAPHHDSDPTPSVYASLFLDLPVVWVSLVQPCLLCRTDACKLHCALWEHVPRVLTPHKHPPQELLFEEFTPTTLIQFVNLYHTQTDIKKMIKCVYTMKTELNEVISATFIHNTCNRDSSRRNEYSSFWKTEMKHWHFWEDHRKATFDKLAR